MNKALKVTVRNANTKPVFTILDGDKRVGSFTASLRQVTGNVGSLFTAIIAALVYGESMDIEKRLFYVNRDSIVGDNVVTEFLRETDWPYLTVQNVKHMERQGVQFLDDDGLRFSPQKQHNKTRYTVRNIKVARKDA